MHVHRKIARPPGRRENVRLARLRFQRQRRRVQTSGTLRKAAIIGLTALALVGAAMLSTLVVGVPTALAFAGTLSNLPSPEGISNRTFFRSTKILDRNGLQLYEIFDKDAGRRTVVPLKDLPPSLIEATIATEDAYFFENPGFDIRGIGRAAYQLLTRTGDAGGSTITQQLVRNVLIDPEERMATDDRRYLRKAKEIVLAVQVNQRYSKDEILGWYLNEILYGNLSYGIEAASKSYFNKSAKELNLAESALLAGLPQAPSKYDPTINPAAAKERQEYVLDLMAKQHYISSAEAEAAKAVELQYRAARYDIKAPHFVAYVREILEEKYGADRVNRGGLIVYTTLDYGLQQEAERIIREHIDSVARFNAHDAALVSINPQTGEIVSMVGSYDYFNPDIAGQVNVALAERQPGSSIKPITYVTAFRKGFTPATVVNDEPLTLPGPDGKPYSPKNNDGKFRGPVKLRYALGNSLNIPAIKVLQFAGISDMIEMARAMGITSFRDPSRYGVSLTLGGGEVRLLDLTSAYSVFASGGVRHEPTPILKVMDPSGRVLDQLTVDDSKRPLTPELAYLITDILSDNEARAAEFGYNSPLRLSRPAAVKTGTTDDSRDAWAVGYTPDLATGVWVGNANNAAMVNILGSRAAGPIWNEFMEMAHTGKLIRGFARPAGIVPVSVCIERAESGGCATSASDIYIRGYTPKPSIDFFTKKALVCKLNGRLADSTCNPDDVEDRSFLASSSSDVPEDLLKLGIPPMPTEKCDCVKGSGTVTGTVGTGTPGASKTPGASGTPPPAGTPHAGANASVSITSPSSGSVVKGTVAIVGSAAVADFAAYKLEIGQGETSSQRRAIAESGKPVTNGTLGSWATAGSPNSVHSIILTVYNKHGRSFEYKTVVRVAN